MASGQAITRKRRGISTTTAASNSVKKWLKTRRVGPGDIITFRSNNIHMFGSTGTVVGYLTKHEVLIRTFGGSDQDYPPQFISVYDREPNPNHHQSAKTPNRSGSMLCSYGSYIQKVVYRNSPKPAKKRRPVKMLPVTRDELPAVLTGAVDVDGHHVVLTETTPVVPEQTQP